MYGYVREGYLSRGAARVFVALLLLLTLFTSFPLPVYGQVGDGDEEHREIPPLDLIILVDESETMWNRTDTGNVRVNTVDFLIDMLSSEQSGPVHRVGIISFGTEARIIPYTLLDGPAAAEELKAQFLEMHNSVAPHKDAEYTDINKALKAALDMMEYKGDPLRKPAVILISDGQPTNPKVSEKKGQDTVMAYLEETRSLMEQMETYSYDDRICPNKNGAPLYMIGLGVENLGESSSPEYIALYREFWQGISGQAGGYYKEAGRVQEMQSISTYIFSELLCTPATPSIAVHSPQILEYQVHEDYFQIFFSISGKENPEMEATVYRPKQDGTAGGEALGKNEEGVSWRSNGIDYEMWVVDYSEPWTGTWRVSLEGEGRAEFGYVFFPNMTIDLYEPQGGFLPADRPFTVRARIRDEEGQVLDIQLKDFQVEIEGEDGFRRQVPMQKDGDTFFAGFDALEKKGEYSLTLHALLPDGTPVYSHRWFTIISAPWIELSEPARGDSYMALDSIPLQAVVHLAGATSFEDVKLITTLMQDDKAIQTVEMSRGETTSRDGENVVEYSGAFRPVEEGGNYSVQAEMTAILPGGRVFHHEIAPIPVSIVVPMTPTPSPTNTSTPAPTSTSTSTATATATATAAPTPTTTPTPVPFPASLTESTLCLPVGIVLALLLLLLVLLWLWWRSRHEVVPDKVKLLAKLMCSRRESGENPYVLVLGSGTSMTLGSSSMRRVLEAVTVSEDPDIESYYGTLDGLSPLERYVILSKHFSEADVSPGYRCLAKLVGKGFFDVIFTTNVGPFLEDALGGEKLDVVICGEKNGIETMEILERPKPRVKVVKLHGDVNTRSFAFTPSEITTFGTGGERVLRHFLGRDVIIVGHGTRDYDINRAIEREGGSIWYVDHDHPSDDNPVFQAMRSRGTQANVISGEFGLFDRFFEALHDELMRC